MEKKLDGNYTRMRFDLISRVFANGPEDRVSIPGLVIPKTQKITLGANLFYPRHYKVRIKGKLERSREWGSTLPHTAV